MAPHLENIKLASDHVLKQMKTDRILSEFEEKWIRCWWSYRWLEAEGRGSDD